MASYAQGSSRASNIQIKKSEAIDEVHPLGGYPVVRKLERKAGASISALVDKYPKIPTHRKHTESAGNFKAEVASERHTKGIYGDLVPDVHHFHEW